MASKAVYKDKSNCVAQVEADKRLRSFFSNLCDDLYYTSPSCASQAFSISRQYSRMEKRAAFGDTNHLAQKALADFKNVNEEASKVLISLDPQIVGDAREFIENALWRYTRTHVSDSIQEALNYGLFLQLWRYGPGASIGSQHTHFADKIVQKTVSVTRSAHPHAVILRRMNPYTSRFDLANNTSYDLVEGSRMTTVPKNQTTHRTICTEPLMNMALQLAAGSYLEGALGVCGGRINNQEDKNKRLAYLGSLDGSLATIDLRSASDLITPALVKLLMPPEWYSLLMSIRSPKTEINGEFVQLNMMSTMGNGFTFPLMTLILRALVYAVMYKNRLTYRGYFKSDIAAVYGDDIIIPSIIYDEMCSVLTSSGLSVNSSKSYHVGPFRESCGGDYFNGVDVTPFYVESLASDPEVYVAINKMALWCARNNVYLERSLIYLRSLLGGPCLFVPFWEAEYSGIRCLYVKRWYKLFEIQRVTVVRTLRYGEGEFLFSPEDMLCILGGYVEGWAVFGQRVAYTRRCRVQRYSLRSARLPDGYLDGYDPSIDRTLALRISGYTTLIS